MISLAGMVLIAAGQGLISGSLLDPLDQSPPWLLSDIPLVIERVGIEDADRQAILSQLVRDFNDHWSAAVSGYSSDRASRPHTNPSEWAEARRTLAKANETYLQQRDAAKELKRRLESGRTGVRYSSRRPPDALGMQLIEDALGESKVELNASWAACRAARDRIASLQVASEADQDSLLSRFNQIGQQLIEGLEADISIFLLPDELEEWHRVKKDIARRRHLRAGHLQGEHVDLDAVVRVIDPQLTDETRDILSQVLPEWRSHIDELLSDREAALLNAPRSFSHASSESWDPTQAILAMKVVLDARRAVRDRTWDAIADTCQSLTDADQIRILRGEYRRRAFPSLYYRSRVERAVQSAIDDGMAELHPALPKILELHANALRRVRPEAIQGIMEFDGTETLYLLAVENELDRPDLTQAFKKLDRAQNMVADVDKEAYVQLVMVIGEHRARRLMDRH